MKLLFSVFCCLSVFCVFWTEASPFFFNIQKTFIPRTTQHFQTSQNVQIQRRPVATQGINFGLGSFISKWFPNIVVQKQIGTTRPKATQRPVVEVTTIFEASDLDKEEGPTSSIQTPEEIIDYNQETSSSSSYSSESSFNTGEEYSSTWSSSSSSSSSSTEATTTTTSTTGLPFEELEPFTESKTTTTTTELPFEETDPSPEGSSFSVTSESSGSFTEIKTSSTPATTTTTTTTELPLEVTEDSNVNKVSSTEASIFYTENESTTTTITTSPDIIANKPSTVLSQTSPSTNTVDLINQIGFTSERNNLSSSTEATNPSIEYIPSGSNKEEVATIKPTTYRPVFTTTTTTTNAPWKETPTNLINTGGVVNLIKPLEPYVYPRPEVSADEIFLNEVSPKARPFGSLSLIGTTNNNNNLLETIYKPEIIGGIDDRPTITFYSNY